MKDCCSNSGETEKRKNKGIFQGLLFGILPHSFCIAFIVFTVIGSTVAAGFFRKFLLTPYFFQILIGLSFVFAAISALIYLKKKDKLTVRGIKENRGYLGILFGTTIAVNLLLFLVIFPATANIKTGRNGQKIMAQNQNLSGMEKINLKVNIPCSGHAPLIIDELKKEQGIIEVKYVIPDVFEVSYNPQFTNLEKILQFEIFKSFPVTLI